MTDPSRDQSQATRRSVLVLNSGSSSLKLRAFQWPDETEVCQAAVSGIGSDAPRWSLAIAGRDADERRVAAADHAEALALACDSLTRAGVLPESGPTVVGHRVVHGGDRFAEAAELTDAVIAEVDRLSPLAPLHNPANLLGVRSSRQRFSSARHVAVFDTAFHQTLPPAAWRYALPRDLADTHRVRRYGFHGTSHRWAANRAAELLGRPPADLRVVVLHLGAGASAAAVAGGVSIDTSMGMTPLAGLVMATRSGDLDPGVGLYLQREAGLSGEQLDRVLNRESGLVGLCGESDMREVLERAASGDAEASEAIDAYVYRVAAYVGAYAVAMGGLDAVVFTAGVGERSAEVRTRIGKRLSLFDVAIDADRNTSVAPGTDGPVHDAESAVAVLVVAANEELQIAREAMAAIDG